MAVYGSLQQSMAVYGSHNSANDLNAARDIVV
jgi:hypothetical protein